MPQQISLDQIKQSAASNGQPLLWTAAGFAPGNIQAGTAPNVQDFTASGTWTKPANAALVHIVIWGGGGGGGRGDSGTTVDAYPAGGGFGGDYKEVWLAAADLGPTVSVTIGTGGTGGIFNTATDATAGGDSVFNSPVPIRAYGGPAGINRSDSQISRYGIGLRPGGAQQAQTTELYIPPYCPKGGDGPGRSTSARAGDRGALSLSSDTEVGGAANGGHGQARDGIKPGGGGGGSSGTGGNGGSGAGGGGGNTNSGSVGGNGGAGFCRVTTYF